MTFASDGREDGEVRDVAEEPGEGESEDPGGTDDIAATLSSVLFPRLSGFAGFFGTGFGLHDARSVPQGFTLFG